MCGIAGIVALDHPGWEYEPSVTAMLAAMAHRGPDDEGMLVSGPAALGHKRLSIIDLSDAGRQPMRHGHLIVTYNGEVYNYLEIRKELEGLGHRFETATDTEVILHAWAHWGEACLERFTGMWAFALLDEQEGVLFCARDPFGIKPFYYLHEDGRFAFASEIKALLTLIPPRADEDSLLDYLVLGLTDHSERTFFREIRQLLPGRILSLRLWDGSLRGRSYYDLACLPRRERSSVEFQESLQRSVILHLRSDVPVGTCLSGGLDSSVVAALAAAANRENGNDRFSAVTARSEATETDETPYAKRVAEHAGLDWHVAAPIYADFAAHLDRCLHIQEEPVGGPSVFLQYWVMKTAREAGLKVMLDGQGGDETLLGYERYYIAFFLHLLKRGRPASAVREFALAVRHSRMSLGWFLASSAYFASAALRRGVMLGRVPFLREELAERPARAIPEMTAEYFNLEKMQASELQVRQLPHLLRYEDRNSMAFSIEARVPFIEKACVEAALDLDPEDKIRNGYTKYPLRLLAARILPAEIAWRRDKIGFEAPEELWLERHREVMEREVRGSAILKGICRRDPEFRTLKREIRWRLYNVAVWERLFGVAA